MQVLEHCLSNLDFGAAQTHEHLTVYPLLTRKVTVPGYVTLGTAIAGGTATVREVSEGGNVPHLLLENNGAQPILILDGEELLGAKQNRIANVTILAPAKQTIEIPVSCVEAGRWSYNSAQFSCSDSAQFLEGRRRKTARVTESLNQGGVRDAQQSEVWDQINLKAARMSVESDTSAMADIYDHHQSSISDYVSAFSASATQVGAVFAIRSRIEGLELFDCPPTLAELLPKLIRSYAIDAIEHRETQTPPSADAARSFAHQLAKSEIETYPGVGLGTEIRLTAPGIIAAGLVEDNRVVHLAAFTAPANEHGLDDSGSSRLQNLMARRRRWNNAA